MCRAAEAAALADDPAHLAGVVAAAAFRGALQAEAEEQLRSPEAPAAMAAKLRARLSSELGVCTRLSSELGYACGCPVSWVYVCGCPVSWVQASRSRSRSLEGL